MKKKSLGMFFLVIFSLIIIVGCGNNNKKVYEEFKERYKVDYSDKKETDEFPLSIYDIKGTFYVTFINENDRVRYYKWHEGTDVKEGLIYESEGDWTKLVGNSKPNYEQNLK